MTLSSPGSFSPAAALEGGTFRPLLCPSVHPVSTGSCRNTSPAVNKFFLIKHPWVPHKEIFLCSNMLTDMSPGCFMPAHYSLPGRNDLLPKVISFPGKHSHLPGAEPLAPRCMPGVHPTEISPLLRQPQGLGNLL